MCSSQIMSSLEVEKSTFQWTTLVSTGKIFYLVLRWKHKQHRMGGDLVVDFDDKIWLLTLDLMLLQALRHSIIMHLTHKNGLH